MPRRLKTSNTVSIELVTVSVRNTLEFPAVAQLGFAFIMSIDKLNTAYSHIPADSVQIMLVALAERF